MIYDCEISSYLVDRNQITVINVLLYNIFLTYMPPILSHNVQSRPLYTYTFNYTYQKLY